MHSEERWVTSPNEPGYPGPGDGPNGNGSVDRRGTQRPGSEPAADAGEATPRKRAGARPSRAQQRQPSEPKPREIRPTGRAPSPNAEARLSRFISGTAAPGGPKTSPPDVDPAPVRADSRQNEAYASELPDLSGPIPRGGQRHLATDEAAAPPTTRTRTESRVQVSNRPRGPVRASMQIRRIDPWSTLKVSLVLSVALFFVWMIAVAFLYLVLGGMGVWSKLNSNVGDLLNNTSGSADLVSSGTIFGGAVLIGLVNIVLLTAAATIGAFIYNLTTDLIGGVEVTLADRD
jgi:hypothetical protein